MVLAALIFLLGYLSVFSEAMLLLQVAGWQQVEATEELPLFHLHEVEVVIKEDFENLDEKNILWDTNLEMQWMVDKKLNAMDVPIENNSLEYKKVDNNFEEDKKVEDEGKVAVKVVLTGVLTGVEKEQNKLTGLEEDLKFVEEEEVKPWMEEVQRLQRYYQAMSIL